MEWLIKAGGNAENVNKYDCIAYSDTIIVNCIILLHEVWCDLARISLVAQKYVRIYAISGWPRARGSNSCASTLYETKEREERFGLLHRRTSTRKPGNVNRVLGVSFIVYGTITEIIYMLVLSVMVRKCHRRLSCYKIMIALGFYDMCAISLNSVLSGYFWLTGANYCVHPTLIYVTGALALGLWCGTCMNCFVLVVNRLLDIWDRHFMEIFFKGKRTYLVLLLPTAYAFCFSFFTPPVLFNSDHTAWFFTPFTTNHKIEEYVNYPHTINNLLVVAATTMLYVLYAKMLLRSSRGSKLSWAQKSFFIQTSSICMANLIGSLVYVYMQFFEAPAYFILIGHVSWMLGQGFPAFVYLILNRTIGREVLKSLKIGKWKNSSVTTTNASKVVVSTATASQI